MSVVLSLFANLRTGTLTDATGGELLLPDHVLGDTRTYSLRFLALDETNTLVEQDLRIRNLNVSVGKIMAPPASGQFSIKIEGTEVGPIDWDATISEFVTAVNAVEAVALSELGAPACWLVSFTQQTELAVVTGDVNTLSPESLVRIRRKQRAGRIWYEIRLIQEPLAWNVDGFERKLAPAPSVERLVTGAPSSGEADAVNEIQRIYYPPEFRGTYSLRWALKTTRVLGPQDGPADIAAALNAMYSDKAERFRVSNVETNYEHVEFVGELAGAEQSIIEVIVQSFPPGTVHFSIPYDRENLDTELRNPLDADGNVVNFIDTTLEIEAEVLDDEQDPEDEETPGKIVTLCQHPIRIVREQKWKELTAVRVVDFLVPGAARDYVQATTDQILYAAPGFSQVIGNGTLKEFTITHTLNTRKGIVAVYVNDANRRTLQFGGEYIYSFPSNSAIALTFAVPPASNGVEVLFMALQDGAFYNAHTHTKSQIVDLESDLASIVSRLQALEAYLPEASPARDLPAPGSIDLELPKRTLVIPSKTASDAQPVDETKLSLYKGQKLLPAIHDASVDDLNALPLPSVSTAAGKVYRNNTGSAITLPLRSGIDRPIVAAGEFFGSDGRQLYRLTRRGTSNSYFPRDFETTLWQTFVKEGELRVKWRVYVDCELKVRTLAANTAMQARIVLEFGTATAQSSPNPTALNLRDIEWNTTPLLSEQIIVMPTPRLVRFGAQVRRTADATFEALGQLYGSTIAAGAVPTSANLALRARLVDLDPVDTVTRPTGLLHVISSGKLTIDKP